MAVSFRALCGIDFLRGSKDLFGEALALSQGHGGGLTVLNVTAGRQSDAQTRDSEIALAAMHQMAENAGVQLRVILRHGVAASVILEVAHGNRFDLVVLGARQRSRTKWPPTLSVSANVVRRSRAPVLVVPIATDVRRTSATFKVVLCPTDLATTPANAVEIDLAMRVARWGQGHVSLLHVFHGESSQHLPRHKRWYFSEWDRRCLLLRAASLRLGMATSPADNVGLPVYQAVTGRPSVEILRTASDLGADIIVMRNTRRGPIRRGVFGSTVERVRQHAVCPVLVLPAAGRALPAASCWPTRRDEPGGQERMLRDRVRVGDVASMTATEEHPVETGVEPP